MSEMANATAVIGNNVPASAELVLVGSQSFDAHRTACMQLAVAYSHLCSEAITVAVRKPRGGIVKYTGGVDFLQKTLGDRLVFRDNTFRVLRAVPVNVLQSLFYGIYDSHR